MNQPNYPIKSADARARMRARRNEPRRHGTHSKGFVPKTKGRPVR